MEIELIAFAAIGWGLATGMWAYARYLQREFSAYKDRILRYQYGRVLESNLLYPLTFEQYKKRIEESATRMRKDSVYTGPKYL